MNKLKILLWRSWTPLYDYPAIFSSVDNFNMGGTCNQLLWHARHLALLGHSVQVLGISPNDAVEEGVDFIGATTMRAQEEAISTGRVSKPDIIFLEGGFKASTLFRNVFPISKIIHVGQNIDTYGWKDAFAHKELIDLFAFVSPGHLAEYSVRFPSMRHKFVLIRNIVPWHWVLSKVQVRPARNRIAWVGAWTKRGLYQWAQTMQRILNENPDYEWVLYGPSHGKSHGSYVDRVPGKEIFPGLFFRDGQLIFRSLPLAALAGELCEARLVLVSLGNETACISALDAHAMGRPVVSGNDMVFKYINPEGTGVRVFGSKERYFAVKTLISDPGLCDELGRAGRELVIQDYSEPNQSQDIVRVLQYLAVKPKLCGSDAYPPPGKLEESALELVSKIRRRLS